MKSEKKGRMRLSIRLALLVFLGQALILGTFAATVYFYCRKVFYDSLDFALEANAESLATLVEKEDVGEHPELEFADEVMRRFSRKKRPDLFAVIINDGQLLEKSKSLEKIPPFVHHSDNKKRFQNFRNRGRHYRGVVLSLSRKMEKNPDRTFQVRVFFASSTHPLGEELEDIAEFIAWFYSVGLLISFLLAGLISWRGLAPLRRLALETGKIRAESLDRRLSSRQLPRDLVPLAGAVNNLLERLETAFERERQFSSDAAHELRTPVTTLKSGIQAALLAPPDSRADRRVLRDLLVDVERLEGLCDSLLLMARETANGNTPELAVTEWIEEIRNTMEGLEALAEENGSRIVGKFPDQIPEGLFMKTDASCTRRIAMNLIHNAIAHCGKGTTVRVEVDSGESGGHMIVRDDGPGIDPEDVYHLFQRFFRADQSRARTTGGFGLGLAISRTLARIHEGEIQYSPEPPHGSRFTWHCVGSIRHP